MKNREKSFSSIIWFVVVLAAWALLCNYASALTISCPPDITISCDSPTGPGYTGHAAIADPCGHEPAITYTDSYSDQCPVVITRKWQTTDASDAPISCQQKITLKDTEPPTFHALVKPDILWPPNNEMVQIMPVYSAFDNCDFYPEIRIADVTINEPNSIAPTDNTMEDVMIDIYGSLYLRAKRNESKNDRTYTITFEAFDNCGNTSTQTTTVIVPSNQRMGVTNN